MAKKLKVGDTVFCEKFGPMKHQFKGTISSDELGLPVKDSKLILPCGIYARWENKE